MEPIDLIRRRYRPYYWYDRIVSSPLSPIYLGQLEILRRHAPLCFRWCVVCLRSNIIRLIGADGKREINLGSGGDRLESRASLCRGPHDLTSVSTLIRFDCWDFSLKVSLWFSQCCATPSSPVWWWWWSRGLPSASRPAGDQGHGELTAY